jgi:pilus assembly protein CpaE
VESALIEHDIRRATPLLIGVAQTASPELLLSAMRAGIPEFVTAPINAKELDAAVDRLVRRTVRAPSATGITFAVYSAKGGLGTTTVAVNLAAALAHASPETRIALVDFVVVGGDIRVMLDAKVAYDVGDLVSKVDRIDAELLNALLTPGPDGVWLLPSSDKTEVLELIDANAATSILAHLRSHFGYVVVDTEHYLGERTIAALDAAEHILLVTQLSVPALRSAQRTLQLFDRLGYDKSKVHVVVNRANAESPLSSSDAESVLGRPIEWKLPNDFGACTAATTKGVPVIDIATNSPLARSYRDLVARLLAGHDTPVRDGTLVPPTPKTGRLFRLAGR